VDMMVRGTLLVTAPTLVLGVTPTAAGLIPAFAIGINLVQHCNIRTPRWLGYIIQRPEMHGLHHARYRDLKGKMWNYADLPIIDMIFGTYKNPETFAAEVGFEGAYSMSTLMRGVDVTLGERESAQRMDPPRGTNIAPSIERMS